MRQCLAIAVLAILVSPPASVAAEGASKLSGSLGIGVASMRDYDGGGESRVSVVPLISLEIPTRLGPLVLGFDGLRWTPIDTGSIRAGVFASYDSGRSDHDSDNFRAGSSYLQGMGDIRGTPAAGVSVDWTVGTVAASVSVRHAVGSEGHDGTVVNLDVTIPVYSGATLQLAVHQVVTWSDSHYNRTYFGVTSEQAARSRFAVYQADGGFQSTQLDFIATYALTQRWALMAMASYYRLIGHAANSPIVQEAGYPVFATFLAWNF